MKAIRLVIAVPSTHLWEAEFGMSLVFLTNYIAANGLVMGKEISFRVHNKRGSLLSNMRHDMVQSAIDHGATHLLFIDSDQTFPPDTFHRLVKHQKHIVAANITTKMFPAGTTARLQGNPPYGVPLITKESDKGLVEVWRVGTGIMLIDLNVFKREGLRDAPWFTPRWNEELKHDVGEDWAFCERLIAAGVKIYVDQELSYEVGHIGQVTYNHTLVVEEELKRACGHN